MYIYENKQLGIPKNYRLDRKTNDTARFALTFTMSIIVIIEFDKRKCPRNFALFFKQLGYAKSSPTDCIQTWHT